VLISARKLQTLHLHVLADISKGLELDQPGFEDLLSDTDEHSPLLILDVLGVAELSMPQLAECSICWCLVHPLRPLLDRWDQLTIVCVVGLDPEGKFGYRGTRLSNPDGECA